MIRRGATLAPVIWRKDFTMALVSCAALLAALASTAGGQSYTLTENCADIIVQRYFKASVEIDAGGHTISGFTVAKGAGNLTLRGGTVTARRGEVAGIDGYAVMLRGSRTVTIDNMSFVRFNRGVVTDFADQVKIINSRFAMGQDGIIANGGTDLEFSSNKFWQVSSVPTRCVMGGQVEEGLSAGVCKAKGGAWTDGWHQDAIQLRNGIRGLRIIGNTIEGVQQGIGQMDASTDAPLEDVVVRDNKVSVSGFHSITFGATTNLTIIGNSVAQETGRRTLIRANPDALVCGNKIQSPKDPGGQRCRAD